MLYGCVQLCNRLDQGVCADQVGPGEQVARQGEKAKKSQWRSGSFRAKLSALMHVRPAPSSPFCCQCLHE